MTMHIQKFVDRVRGLEAKGSRDFSMSMQEAKDLHADITRLLLQLENVRQNPATEMSENTAIQVQIAGGTFR